MAQRTKRSISLPPGVAEAVEEAARAAGMTVSAWLAATASHRLKVEAGLRAVAEFEAENGAFTDAERAAAAAWLDDAMREAEALTSEPSSQAS